MKYLILITINLWYDDDETRSFSEGKYLNIIKNIGVNVVMIAHQKETLSSGRCVVCYKR